MNNLLYKDHADLYEVIAKDRNFLMECCEFIRIYEKVNDFTLKPEATILELFAGPGYHTHCFNQHFTPHTFCIDNSAEMRTIAMNHYHLKENHYYLGTIPHIITALPPTLKFDLIICPRYSIGLIDDGDLKQLFSNLENHINPGCVFIFECHQIKNLLSHFNLLTIKNRKTSVRDQEVTCAWPHREILWQEDEWSVLMPIEVMIKQGNTKKLITTYSKERIYVKNDFKRLLDGSSIYTIVDNLPFENTVFTQSKLIIIKVSSLV